MLILQALICLNLLPAVNAVSVARRLEQLRHVTIRVPGYTPTQSDEYVGISIPAPSGFIVGFEPIAKAERVHHMLLYGCRLPYMKNQFWRSGETCSSPSHILYSWARNAPALYLPDDVAISVGHELDLVKYIVLQVHYAFPFDGNILDFSGVTLHYIEEKPLYLAGIFLFVSQRTAIPAGLHNYYVNMSCEFRSETLIYPFAFRTHTHSMGRVVSAAFKNESGWTLIGKSNPQWPQLFNKINSSLIIKNGDLMAAKCLFDSSGRNSTVYIGSTGADEMCNFYMMYYRDANLDDPFPLDGICSDSVNAPTVNLEYPAEGLSRLPLNPELETEAHQMGRSFGIYQRNVLTGFQNKGIGQVSGLAFDADGSLVIFHRGTRKWGKNSFDANNVFVDKSPIQEDTIWVLKTDSFSKQNHLVAQFGKNQFYLPHGIFINQKNEYFTTDVGAQLVTKWKLTKNGLEEIFSLGAKFVPGQDREHFCLPTAVVTSPADGSIFVSDGYCNNRIVKFAANGKYLKDWGETYYGISDGSFPITRGTLGMFALPHDISLNEDGSRLYVSDRQNARVQIFDSFGLPRAQISNLPNQTLFTTVYSAHYHGNSVYFIPGDPRKKGRIFCAKADSADLLYSYEPPSSELQMAHVIRVSPDGRFIYVGELSNSSSGKVLQFEIVGEGTGTVRKVGVSDANELPNGGSSYKRGIIFLIIVIVFGAACYFFTRRVKLYRSGPKHSVLDRAGFKPLRMDYPSSEDDSDEDDTVISQIKSDARF